MKNRIIIIAGMVLSLSLLIGCGKKNEDYTYYEKEVQSLYETIVTTDSVLNNLDASSESSKEEFFKTLDKLEQSFSDFSSIDAPEKYDNCEVLSSKAVDYLNSAKVHFHEALDGDYDEKAFNDGIANYNDAVKCVNYMGMVLQGKQISFH